MIHILYRVICSSLLLLLCLDGHCQIAPGIIFVPVTCCTPPAISVIGCMASTSSTVNYPQPVLSPPCPLGGAWGSSNPAKATVDASGTIFGVASGTSIISYTVACATTSKVVTMEASPSGFRGTFPTCPINSVSISSSAGGTWASSNTTVATVGTSGITTALSAGVYTITYTLTYAGVGTCAIVKTTTVGGPVAITGTTATTIGGTTTLSDATTGGTWSSSNAGVATVGSTTGVVSGVGAGTTTITYKVTAGGCTNAFTTTTVTVSGISLLFILILLLIILNPKNKMKFRLTILMVAVTLSAHAQGLRGSENICANTTTALSGPGASWTSSNHAVATVSQTGVVTGVSAGTSTINYYSSAGTTMGVVTVNASPGAIRGAFPQPAVNYLSIPGDSTYRNSVTLNDMAGGVFISTDSSIASFAHTGASDVLTAVGAGNVSVYYVLPNGCSSAIDIFTIEPY